MATDWKEVLKTLMLYIALPIGALVIIYKLVSDWLLGPAKHIESLLEQAIEEYMIEAKQYAEEDQGALTEDHIMILDEKRKLIDQLQQTYIELTKMPDWLVNAIYIITFAVAGRILLPKIVEIWKGRVKSGDVQSEMGASYIALCMLADDLAERGYTSYASALANTIAMRFENVDKPYMESQIAYWQSQLPNLTGWQLLYANYIITAYQVTINMVPIWISYLPPPVLEMAGIEIKARA